MDHKEEVATERRNRSDRRVATDPAYAGPERRTGPRRSEPNR